jgi:acetyl-CoA C-acetyltransferase
MVKNSPVLWDPIRYLETCPSSDGAGAMILVSEDVAEASGKKVAWVHGTANRTEAILSPRRNQVLPKAGSDCAKALYKEAGITDPKREIDTAEIYVPFAWFEPMWLENIGLADANDGWKMVDAGDTMLGGRQPINPSGGVLSSNPIGASGMLRFLEAAHQVRGTAGEHQVEGAKKALGHAYGGGSQYFAMWIVGAEKP